MKIFSGASPKNLSGAGVLAAERRHGEEPLFLYFMQIIVRIERTR